MNAEETSPRCYALLPCAGRGQRAGGVLPKQYQMLAGQCVVQHTLAAFARVPRIARVLLVVAPGDDYAASLPAGAFQIARCGGASRAESVFNGLQALLDAGAAPHDWVLVHDAARCLIEPAHIDALIDAALPDACGALLALPLVDTLKSAEGGRAHATLPREGKWLAQTPQMFRIGALRAALAAHQAAGFAGITDEASAMEAAGGAPLLVPGSAHNFKLTYPEDFALAEAVLHARAQGGTP